jgi:hypothetical protein
VCLPFLLNFAVFDLRSDAPSLSLPHLWRQLRDSRFGCRPHPQSTDDGELAALVVTPSLLNFAVFDPRSEVPSTLAVLPSDRTLFQLSFAVFDPRSDVPVSSITPVRAVLSPDRTSFLHPYFLTSQSSTAEGLPNLELRSAASRECTSLSGIFESCLKTVVLQVSSTGDLPQTVISSTHPYRVSTFCTTDPSEARVPNHPWFLPREQAWWGLFSP